MSKTWWDAGPDKKNSDHSIAQVFMGGSNEWFRCEFEFEGDSKGFEGAVGFPDEDDVLYVGLILIGCIFMWYKE